MASSREQVEEAYAGDIIGLPNHGNMQIGDSFSEGELLQFTGIPYFAPDFFRSVRIRNPLKIKQLHKGLQQLGEEGAVQVFKPVTGGDLVLGAVGVLQFEVVASRLMNEYGVDAVFVQRGHVGHKLVAQGGRRGRLAHHAQPLREKGETVREHREGHHRRRLVDEGRIGRQLGSEGGREKEGRHDANKGKRDEELERPLHRRTTLQQELFAQQHEQLAEKKHLGKNLGLKKEDERDACLDF